MMWDFFHFTPEIKLFFESCFSDEVCRLQEHKMRVKGFHGEAKRHF